MCSNGVHAVCTGNDTKYILLKTMASFLPSSWVKGNSFEFRKTFDSMQKHVGKLVTEILSIIPKLHSTYTLELQLARVTRMTWEKIGCSFSN